MIKIEFFIKEFPKDLSRSYALDAYTEGVLTIHVNGKIVFDENGILLVELSNKLEPWVTQIDLDPDSEHNFYYASMDEEEEPVLAFNYDATDKSYRISSIWSSSESAVKKDELLSACKKYISELRCAVQERIRSNN